MSHFYEVYLERGGSRSFVWSGADLEAYSEPAEFTTFAAGVTAPKALKRLQELRHMRPVGRASA